MPTLLDYQDAAATWLAGRKKALLQSPAGSGKTVILAAAIARVMSARQRDRKARVGWIANTREQVAQAHAAVADEAGLLDAIEFTACCPGGIPQSWDFDVLVVDEAHHSTAPTWLAIITAHTGALWLCTATPFGSDQYRNAALRELVDNHIYVVHREATGNRVVPAHVYILHDTDDGLQPVIEEEIERQVRIQRRYSPLPDDQLRRNVASQACLAFGVIPNVARNAAIVRTALRHAGDATLILVPTIEHGHALAAKIPDSVMCFSKMGMRKRREAIAGFREGGVDCLISTSLADEGLDVPRANVLILGTAGRSPSKVEQRTGRVLRAHGDKTHGTIYDFSDLQHPLLAWQSRARRDVYRRLGYNLHLEAPAMELAGV